MHRSLLALLTLAACAGGAPEAEPPAATPPVAPAPTTATAAPSPSVEPEPAPPVPEPEEAWPTEPPPEKVMPADPGPPPEPTLEEDDRVAAEPVGRRAGNAKGSPPGPPPTPDEAAPEPDAEAPAPATEGPATDGAEHAPPDPPARTYTLSDRSTLYVQVFKDPDTLAAGLSHDHVVKAGRVRGSFTWDPDDATACDIRVEVPVSGLIVDPPRLREAVGLEGTLSEKQRDDVAKNMRSKAQLWADKHGTITFRSTGCAEAGDGAVRVTGDLTVRGQAARKTVTLAIDAGAADLAASGSFTANASDFGFSPYTAMAGALKNLDQMRFTVKLRGSVR